MNAGHSLPALAGAAIGWLALAFWGTEGVRVSERVRRLPALIDVPLELPAGVPTPPPAGPVGRLAVIMPACNEEAGLPEALASLLAQDVPNLLVIPIDDRSTDRTGAIMDHLAAADSRVCPIHVALLPAGWLGKNHANWLGWQRARDAGAEWLLFTDGDVLFGPGALRRALTVAQASRLDLLAVTPELIRQSFWQLVFASSFLFWFLFRFQPWDLERPGSRRYIGVGAFTLVRRAAYESMGTHERLRLSVIDDVALGKLMRDAGGRLALYGGREQVQVEWQPNFAATVRGLYKNGFAGVGFRLPVAAGSVAGLLALNVVPFAAPFFAIGLSRWAADAGLLLLLGAHFRANLTARRGAGFAAAMALLSWFGTACFAWAMAASTWQTLHRGGVTWRGTFYPLDVLRGGQIRA